MDERLTVRLHKILRGALGGSAGDCYRVIGTVHRGMEFGFLAIARDGCYLQVNGSVVQRLNRADVDAAIYSAEHLCVARPPQAFAPAHPAEPVTVIRKKRRMPADAGVAPDVRQQGLEISRRAVRQAFEFGDAVDEGQLHRARGGRYAAC